MGNVVEPGKPVDCPGSCWLVGEAVWGHFTQAECVEICSGQSGSGCPSTAWRDRGANVNPRYCIYVWVSGGCWYRAYDFIQCDGTYSFGYCSDDPSGSECPFP